MFVELVNSVCQSIPVYRFRRKKNAVTPFDEKSIDFVSNFTRKGEERTSMFRVAQRDAA